MLNNFHSHIKSIYELEMFYGDQTLEHLLNHAKELSENIENLDLVLNEKEESSQIAEEKEKKAN